MFKKIVCFCTSLALSSLSLFSCPVNIVAETSETKIYTLSDLHSDNLIFNERYDYYSDDLVETKDLMQTKVPYIEWFDDVFEPLYSYCTKNGDDVSAWFYTEHPIFWVYSEIIQTGDKGSDIVEDEYVEKFCKSNNLFSENDKILNDNISFSNNISDYTINYSDGNVWYSLKENKSENTQKIEFVNSILDSNGFDKHIIKVEDVSVDGCPALRVYYAYNLWSYCFLYTLNQRVRVCKSHGNVENFKNLLADNNIYLNHNAYNCFVLSKDTSSEYSIVDGVVIDDISVIDESAFWINDKSTDMISNKITYSGRIDCYTGIWSIPFKYYEDLDKTIFYGDIDNTSNYVYQDIVYVREPYDLRDGTVVFCDTPYTISFLWTGTVNVRVGMPSDYDYDFTDCKTHHFNVNQNYNSKISISSYSKMTDIFKYDVENDKLCKYNGNNLEYLTDDELHYNVPITIGDVSVEYHVNLKHPQQGRTVVYKVGEQQPEKVYTEDDLNLGDIDSNGKIEIQDCQILLMYYTENLTGNDVGNLKDFVNKNN